MGPITLAAFIGASLMVPPRAPAAPLTTAEPAATACLIRYWTEARQRYPGYDHLVHIHNGCDLQVLCTIHTNVRPKPLLTTVSGSAKVAVLTFRGSPARTFNASVTCQPSS